jgi:uncharacterized protein YqeY
MSLKEQLAEDMKSAMRSGDTLRRDTVRMARNAIDYAEKAKGQPLNEAEEIAALQRQARQRKDSIEAYHAVGRDEAEAQEAAELAIIEEYLPKQMGKDEVEAVVREVIAKVGATGPGDKGKVMGPLMQQLKGQADGNLVNSTVTELLGA